MNPQKPNLHIVQLRPGVLYACRCPGKWLPIVLLAGFALWLLGVAGVFGLFSLRLGVLAACAGIGTMVAGTRLLMDGAWLSIDIARGWVHWRRRKRRRVGHESFSPQRLTGVSVEQMTGAAPWQKGWGVILKMDHPRLPAAMVARFRNSEMALETARAVSQALAIELLEAGGEKKNSVAALAGISPVAPPPPPEVLLPQTDGEQRFLLPNVLGLTGGTAGLLAYAVAWCFWSWTCLVAQLRYLWLPAAAPGEGWMATVWLLSAASLVGILLLVTALARIAGCQALEHTDEGWFFARRWCGCTWDRRRLILRPGDWLRRINYPMVKSGLWAPINGGELRLAPGLQTETIAWVQQMLVDKVNISNMQ